MVVHAPVGLSGEPRYDYRDVVDDSGCRVKTEVSRDVPFDKHRGAQTMIVVVIHWKIKPDRVGEFLEFWKTKAIVDDRRGLIGEFLSEGHSAAEFDWITWPLTGCEGKYRSFVNVGYWNSGEEFQAQVGRYFDSSTGPKDFEAEPRLRTALKPKCWRMGDSKLPIHDSDGVL